MNEIISTLDGVLSSIESSNNTVSSVSLKIHTDFWNVDLTFESKNHE